MNGLHIGKIHGYTEFVKLIDGKPFICDTIKGKLAWVETVIEPSRLKKFRPISELEMVEMLYEESRQLLNIEIAKFKGIK